MEDEILDRISTQYETPLYVLDTEVACQRYKRLQEKLDNIKIKYASKSNFDPRLVSRLHNLGAEFVCGSPSEAMLINQKSSVPPDNLQVTLMYPKDKDIEYLLHLSEMSEDFKTTINSVGTLRRIIDLGYKSSILLRLRPDDRFRSSSKYSAGSELKFGIPEDKLETCIEIIRNSNAELSGFHCHLGGSISGDNLAEFVKHAKHTIDRSESLVDISEIEEINIGGGLGLKNTDNDTPIDLDQLNSLIDSAVPEIDPDIAIEPGRYIAGPSSVLLSEVKSVRKGKERFLGIDAGMSEFPRTTMFDVNLPIRVLNAQDREETPHTVAGPTCSGADIFCSGRELPKARKGDVVIIENVGAYGVVMSNNFHAYSDPHILDLKEEELYDSREILNFDDPVHL